MASPSLALIDKPCLCLVYEKKPRHAAGHERQGFVISESHNAKKILRLINCLNHLKIQTCPELSDLMIVHIVTKTISHWPFSFSNNFLITTTPIFIT